MIWRMKSEKRVIKGYMTRIRLFNYTVINYKLKMFSNEHVNQGDWPR